MRRTGLTVAALCATRVLVSHSLQRVIPPPERRNVPIRDCRADRVFVRLFRRRLFSPLLSFLAAPAGHQFEPHQHRPKLPELARKEEVRLRRRKVSKLKSKSEPRNQCFRQRSRRDALRGAVQARHVLGKPARARRRAIDGAAHYALRGRGETHAPRYQAYCSASRPISQWRANLLIDIVCRPLSSSHAPAPQGAMEHPRLENWSAQHELLPQLATAASRYPPLSPPTDASEALSVA